MAITSGVGPHAAWLSVDGTQFSIERGSVSQQAKRKSCEFNVVVPMGLEDAAESLTQASGGQDAVITVLARGQTSPLFTGKLVQISFDYIGRTIHVRGQDKSVELHNNKTSEKWLNKKPSEIVQDLIGRIGLSGNVASSALMAGKRLEQDFVKLSDNVSFAQVIHKLAELDGARWFVDANVPLGSPQGTYSIQINQDRQPISADCMVLKVTRNLQASKTAEVTVKAWHPKKKQVFSYTSTVKGVGGTMSYNYHIPGLEQDHVEQHAKSQAKEKSRHELTVNATVVGDTSVAAGMGLQLSGTQFDQTFEIDSVHHDFGMGGYRTSITARSAKEGRTVE
jgi:hypothetical protein